MRITMNVCVSMFLSNRVCVCACLCNCLQGLD